MYRVSCIVYFLLSSSAVLASSGSPTKTLSGSGTVNDPYIATLSYPSGLVEIYRNGSEFTAATETTVNGHVNRSGESGGNLTEAELFVNGILMDKSGFLEAYTLETTRIQGEEPHSIDFFKTGTQTVTLKPLPQSGPIQLDVIVVRSEGQLHTKFHNGGRQKVTGSFVDDHFYQGRTCDVGFEFELLYDTNAWDNEAIQVEASFTGTSYTGAWIGDLIPFQEPSYSFGSGSPTSDCSLRFAAAGAIAEPLVFTQDRQLLTNYFTEVP